MGFKSVGVRGSTEPDYPFKINVFTSGNKSYAIVNPRSVIYRSFNWKDMMVHTGYIDKETAAVIKSNEENIDGHSIQGLDQNLELKTDGVVFLKLEVNPNLTPKSAKVEVAGGEQPWTGFPDAIVFNPPIEYDKDGAIKEDKASRFQKASMFVLGYLTDDSTQQGLSVDIDKKKQNLVQVTKTNILLNVFNYDGWPILHGVPYFGGFFDYLSGKR